MKRRFKRPGLRVGCSKINFSRGQLCSKETFGMAFSSSERLEISVTDIYLKTRHRKINTYAFFIM